LTGTVITPGLVAPWVLVDPVGILSNESAQPVRMIRKLATTHVVRIFCRIV